MVNRPRYSKHFGDSKYYNLCFSLFVGDIGPHVLYAGVTLYPQ